MMKRHYLKSLFAMLSLRSLFSGLRAHTTSVSGAVCRVVFHDFMAVKNAITVKQKALPLKTGTIRRGMYKP